MGLDKSQIIGWSIIGGVIILASANYKDFFNAPNPSLTRNNSDFTDKSNAPDAQLFIVTSEDESKKAINEINVYRKQNIKSPINYSTKAYQLALTKAKDMNQFNYFDSTNPQTKICVDSMKLDYGFQPKEFLTESIYRYIPRNGNVSIGGTKTLSEATREWIEIDRQKNDVNSNFLFNYHMAGAVACDGNKCVFLGLNEEEYVKGCVTAKKG